MGCDIHVYLEEVQSNGAFSVARFRPGRDYAMFSLMAGVRSDGEVKLFDPRGLPDNMGWDAKEDYYVRPDEYRSRETIARYVERGSSVWADEKLCIATHPDWHSASWLNAAEMLQVKEAYEQLEFALAGWHSDRSTITANDLALVPGATMDDVIVTPSMTHYGMYHVEIGPKQKAVFPTRYAALLAAMQALGDNGRIVFWFDN